MANEVRNWIRMSGYLDKKGKMKMMSSWKSYWFVLEGRLLLYYRSKDEYEAISPCKGSISLGPTCSVKPLLGTSCVFQIETRVNNIILKAKTRLEQDKWMHALLAALNQTTSTNGMLHFRYSSDEIIPRRNIEDKCRFSRQYTLPERLNVAKRHTFCRSFDTLRSNLQKDVKKNKRKSNTKSNNDITHIGGNIGVNQNAVSPDYTQNVMLDNDVYYAVSPVTDQEREYLRKKSNKMDHIYERISSDSRISNLSREMIENDTYATMLDIKPRFLQQNEERNDEICIDNDIYASKPENHNEGVIIENDQYCTPDIVVSDTKLVSYHEYNLPDKDKHIYSVPNFNNTDHNDNRISSQSNADVNPYSVCHIYPKSPNLKEFLPNIDQVYDNIVESSTSNQKEQKNNPSKELKKCKVSNKKDDVNIMPVSKKNSFLQKLFKKRKKKKIPEQKYEEIEYAEINEDAGTKMDAAYCIDNKLLAELELILDMKKQKLQKLLQNNEDQICEEINKKEETSSKQNEAETGAKRKPKIPKKVRKKKNPNEVELTNDDKFKNLKSIDEILNELEQMKRNNSLTSGRVKHLIEKFDKAIMNEDIPEKKFTKQYDIVMRRKVINRELMPQNMTYNSNDELSKLLSELAKVTSAPILTPGVTNSLAVTSRTNDPEFIGLLCKNERRLSEPDYDIPRPHTNLRIYRDEDESDENVMTATRFFGPVLPNYERKTPSQMYSITPDSLELDLSTSAETNMPSYSSHKYLSIGKTTRQSHVMTEEIYIDSLEPQDETSTVL